MNKLSTSIAIGLTSAALAPAAANAAPLDAPVINDAELGHVFKANHAAELAGPTALAAATGYLNAAGPAISHDRATANKQLDERLHMEGVDGPTARMVAKAAHITTHAGRAKYITAANVNISSITSVTNKEYPMSSAIVPGAGTVAETPNTHAKSAAARISLEDFPTVSAKHGVIKGKGKDTKLVTDDVLRLDCGFQDLSGKKPKKDHKKPKFHEDKFVVDVSPGVKADADAAFDIAYMPSSSSSSSEIKCDDGTVVKVDAAAAAEAGAAAYATAEAKLQYQKFVIKGVKMSYGKFRKKYDQMVTAEVDAMAKAVAKATSSATTNISAHCGTVPPPPHIDICVNIPGDQDQVPTGYYIDQNGICIESKHDSEGPGADTPGTNPEGGTIGGEGDPDDDGGATDPGVSETCRDDDSTVRGDLNPATQGDLMYGTHDQLGYCVGPAKAMN